MKSKIYTKTGDKGATSLYGGKRLPKDHVRLEAYGDVDELNAHIGYVRSLVKAEANVDTEIDNLLEQTQRQLFDIGAHLATPYTVDKLPPSLPKLSPDMVNGLEQSIDRLDAQLPELKTFILPGGSATASALHITRTVCRRAERKIVALAHIEYVDPLILEYFNRLSDWLFVVARYVNQHSNTSEQRWK